MQAPMDWGSPHPAENRESVGVRGTKEQVQPGRFHRGGALRCSQLDSFSGKRNKVFVSKAEQETGEREISHSLHWRGGAGLKPGAVTPSSVPMGGQGSSTGRPGLRHLGSPPLPSQVHQQGA